MKEVTHTKGGGATGIEGGRAGDTLQEKIVRSLLFCSVVKASIARQ